MIINNINIEGICKDEELTSISLEYGDIINKSIDIKLSSEKKIKEIIEISIKTSVEKYKTIKFQDQILVLTKINTDLDILFVEDNENNLVSFTDRHIEFIYNFKKSNNKKYNINAKIIDCYFSTLDNESISATLIYLINRNEDDIYIGKEYKEDKNKFKLIDFEEEFY